VVERALSGRPSPLTPTNWRPGPVFTEAFRLAGEPDRPRLCFLATAGGDPLTRIAGFHGAFAGTDVRATHLTLFEMPNVDDVREHCSPRT
jgi:hypothetical protein